ncbi:MAG: cyclic nucleotide-binding domain-containing protein, partial [Methylococcaceae bacterium]|nr:cyclic nucleotide-binding domain-containing protein [Methylococcaceae bacterium]
MPFAVTEKDAQDIRRLIPLNTLSSSRFEALCSELAIEEAPRGGLLFKQGDAKNELIYVLNGSVALQAGGMELDLIVGGTEGARFALAHQIPRKVSAVAKDQVRFIRVNSADLNQIAETGSSPFSSTPSTYEVSEFGEGEEIDWMTALLRSRIFRRLSPTSLQNLIFKLEEVHVAAGQVIVHQDEPGDFFYIIKKGHCRVSRKPSAHAKEVRLAELKASDTFGEAA